jgi:Putative peptidoglycan binding domain/LysM domain
MSGVYTVEQGDCLSSIAKAFGFSNWRTIYDHANNADFRQLRPNANVIYPGDEIFIPDLSRREEQRPTDARHTFALKRPKTWLRLLIRDGTQSPAPGCKYQLQVDGINHPDGVTDGNGMLIEEIPADAQSGLLTVWFDDEATHGHTWQILIGSLDPVDTMTGIQARLNNLGYTCGAVDGIIGPLTRSAVRSFQKDNHLTVDAIPGPITQAKLKELHGS